MEKSLLDAIALLIKSHERVDTKTQISVVMDIEDSDSGQVKTFLYDGQTFKPATVSA